jgi:prepilin-type N-terminal cleavage/methylation domain-containing protein/prepilin-type processing-associated H-X9-DG protein
MCTMKNNRFHAYTLIEMLLVLTIVSVLAGLLLPALNVARERGKRVACASNLHQIGLAIQLFASDHDNRTPLALDVTTTPPTPWYTVLTNGGYATPKIFQCPDDKEPRGDANFDGKPDTPRSYAIVVGRNNTTLIDWIAGSRLTCPYLTNSSVVIVGELYNPAHIPPILPVLEGSTGPWITSPSDPSSALRPSSMHEKNDVLAGNYLFLDGHVEWVQGLHSSFTEGSHEDQMFPQVPLFPVSIPPCP